MSEPCQPPLSRPWRADGRRTRHRARTRRFSEMHDADGPSAAPAPAATLDRIAYLLDRSLAPSPKSRAFLKARDLVIELGDDEVARLVADGRLRDLPGIGQSTGTVIEQV